MTTAVLKKNGQPFIEIPVPGGLHDIRLSAYIDFLVEAGKMGEEGTNPVLVMARAVSAFYSVPLADVLQIEAGDLDGDALAQVDGCLRTLYAHAVAIVSNADLSAPDGCHFEHRGQSFSIPAILVSSLTSQPILPPVTTAEAIEAFEVNRLSVAASAADGDPEGSIAFSRILRTLAIFARLDGETMPVEDGAREVFLSERAAFFADVDALSAMRADFFLTNTLTRFGKTHPVIGSLTRPAFVLTAEMRLRKPKRMLGRRNTTKPFFVVSDGGRSLSRSSKRGGLPIPR